MSRLELREFVATWVEQPDPAWVELFHSLRKTRKLSTVMRGINEMFADQEDHAIARHALSRLGLLQTDRATARPGVGH